MNYLKFKAWDIKRKIMYEVDDLYFFEEEGIHEIVDGIAEGHHSTYEMLLYTGLRDKNGKRIYRGDVVYTSEDEHPRLVSWNEFACKFHLIGNVVNGEMNSEDMCYFTSKHNLEVIGSAYEDETLLTMKRGELK